MQQVHSFQKFTGDFLWWGKNEISSITRFLFERCRHVFKRKRVVKVINIDKNLLCVSIQKTLSIPVWCSSSMACVATCLISQSFWRDEWSVAKTVNIRITASKLSRALICVFILFSRAYFILPAWSKHQICRCSWKNAFDIYWPI